MPDGPIGAKPGSTAMYTPFVVGNRFDHGVAAVATCAEFAHQRTFAG
jgi:hypothetical protein